MHDYRFALDEKQAFFIESVSDERAYFGTYKIK